VAGKGAKSCPGCGARGRTTDSRARGRITHRRYKCKGCGARWGTIETREGDMQSDCRPRVTEVLRDLLQEIHAA
jgi:transposase-like protein